jgi:hypothetical protein
MELSTVEIPRAGARERAAAYVREARRESNPERRRELEQIARAYRAAAREGVPLISLSTTIAAGGTRQRTRVLAKGTDRERRVHYLLPRLAVTRPEAAFVFTMGVRENGNVAFIDSLGRDWRYRKGLVDVAAGFAFPDGVQTTSWEWSGDASVVWYAETHSVHPQSHAWEAMVPLVPPEHRPPRGWGDRLLLWEADDWTWASSPAPPHDPALLRPIGGDLYAVEAVWDLTEIERLVLAGRR